MAGCRDLKSREVQDIRAELRATRNPVRDEVLFLVGCNTGFRISSLLSLQLKHIIAPTGGIARSITIERKNVKRKQRGHELVLNPAARTALRRLLILLTNHGYTRPDTYLFHSTDPRRPISRGHAYAIIHAAARRAGIGGRIGTHSMRKTFAMRFYDAAKASGNGDPLQLTQHGLNHQAINSTASYLRVDRNAVDQIARGLKI